VGDLAFDPPGVTMSAPVASIATTRSRSRSQAMPLQSHRVAGAVGCSRCSPKTSSAVQPSRRRLGGPLVAEDQPRHLQWPAIDPDRSRQVGQNKAVGQMARPMIFQSDLTAKDDADDRCELSSNCRHSMILHSRIADGIHYFSWDGRAAA
jgi:hypothetical protein